MAQAVPLAESWVYPHADPSVHIFDEAVWRWALALPEGALVVELGCGETDFSRWLCEARPDVHLVGVDVNPCPQFVGHLLLRVPAETVALREGCVDAVLALGSLEHFGLGAYGDPLAPEADAQTVQRAAAWLKPGGWFYYDVPWTPETFYITPNRHFRVYDDAALESRVTGGLTETHRGYAHGESDAWQDERPTAPLVPYWYVIRRLEKAH